MKQITRAYAALHPDVSFSLAFGALLLLLFAVTSALAAVERKAYPTEVPAGMEKIKSREFDKLYVKPGFQPGDYGKLIIEEPLVALDDQWEWNNRTQVTQVDLDRISGKTSKIMLEQFSEKLSGKSGFTVSQDPAAAAPMGAGVLRLKPSMIDVYPNAAELVRDTGIKDRYTRSAGFATLYLDLYDANTGELLMRIIDRDEPKNRQTLQQTNRGTNYRDTELMVSRWAKALRKHLDDLNSGTA
ncbi:MAG TPA: hypothetical protein VFX02_09165 [Gammaproteobacteria bacterium]|nr:hypothetical protein [Gammaproteobacteria bacterium]